MQQILDTADEFNIGGIVCNDIVAFVIVASSYQFCANACGCSHGNCDGVIYVCNQYNWQYDRLCDFGIFIGCFVGWYISSVIKKMKRYLFVILANIFMCASSYALSINTDEPRTIVADKIIFGKKSMTYSLIGSDKHATSPIAVI